MSNNWKTQMIREHAAKEQNEYEAWLATISREDRAAFEDEALLTGLFSGSDVTLRAFWPGGSAPMKVGNHRKLLKRYSKSQLEMVLEAVKAEVARR